MRLENPTVAHLVKK